MESAHVLLIKLTHGPRFYYVNPAIPYCCGEPGAGRRHRLHHPCRRREGRPLRRGRHRQDHRRRGHPDRQVRHDHPGRLAGPSSSAPPSSNPAPFDGVPPMPAPGLRIYDTTLRDGTQGEGISFSVADKLLIVERLDQFGVDYIEGGFPGSNPRDIAFFAEAKQLKLRHARLAAFGATRRAGAKAEEDPQLRTLLDSEMPVLTIVGKTWLLHVTEILRTTPGGEPGDDRGLRPLPRRPGPRGDLRRRALLRRLPGRSRLRPAHPRGGGPRRREPTCRSARRTAASWCPRSSASRPPSWRASAATRSASTATTTAASASRSRWPASRPARRLVQGTMNGYGERVGNANLVDHPAQPLPQDGPHGALRAEPGRSCATSRSSSTSWPTCGPIPRRPSSASRPSPTRAASTPTPPRRWRAATSTSTPRWSATAPASSSPTWPAAAASPSRRGNSGSSSTRSARR